MGFDELDDQTLLILKIWHSEFPGRLGMPVKKLYDELCKKHGGVSNKLLTRKIYHAKRSLVEKGFIGIKETNSAQIGLVYLTVDGLDACEDFLADEVPELDNGKNENVKSSEIPMDGQPLVPHILSLSQLASSNLEFSSLLERLNEVYRLKSVFYDNLSHNHVAVYFGLPSLGKTTIVQNFQNVALGYFAPIIIDLKNCERDSLDVFLLYFHDLISSELSDLYKDLEQFPAPAFSQYTGGKGKKIFLEFWDGLSRQIPNWKPILIIDEVGTLSDDSYANSDILNFMIEFISNPKNGYFLLVGREKITRSGIDRFRDLIKIGTHLEASSLPFETNQKVIDLIRKQSIKIEADLDKQILFLCDGHPYMVRQFFDTLLIKVSNTRPLEIRLEDFDMAINSTIEKCGPSFYALFQDLSEEEQKVIQEWGPNYKNGETFFELEGTTTTLKNQFQLGVTKLKNRGWVEKIGENKFLFKFILLLIWYRKQNYVRSANEK